MKICLTTVPYLKRTYLLFIFFPNLLTVIICSENFQNFLTYSTSETDVMVVRIKKNVRIGHFFLRLLDYQYIHLRLFISVSRVLLRVPQFLVISLIFAYVTHFSQFLLIACFLLFTFSILLFLTWLS